MIATLEGAVEHKLKDSVIINVAGVGYEVGLSPATLNRLPYEGQTVKLYIAETSGIYGGGTNLYGFLTPEEKDIFQIFKDGLSNTGARKALDYLDKAIKSLPDFRRAVSESDIRILTSIFGFRSRTAEKILVLLKDKLSALEFAGTEKFTGAAIPPDAGSDAVAVLVAMGFKESQAKHAVEEALAQTPGKEVTTGELITGALKHVRE